MKQEITIKLTPEELLTMINDYQGKDITPNEVRLRELQRIYNREVKKHNKDLSIFEAV